jgi:hypothetical protein
MNAIATFTIVLAAAIIAMPLTVPPDAPDDGNCCQGPGCPTCDPMIPDPPPEPPEFIGPPTPEGKHPRPFNGIDLFWWLRK